MLFGAWCGVQWVPVRGGGTPGVRGATASKRYPARCVAGIAVPRIATTEPSGSLRARGSTPTILGIRQIKIPVTDPARSLRWYTKLLGLHLHREFVEQGTLAGAVMSHPGGFVLSVRPGARSAGLLPGSTCSVTRCGSGWSLGCSNP